MQDPAEDRRGERGVAEDRAQLAEAANQGQDQYPFP